jgi:DNA-binding NtrC family response regulator
MSDIPIIKLSGHGERWRIVEAARHGVNEFLIKPVSAKSICDRLVSIITQPRPIVQVGDYYGPESRKHLAEPPDDADVAKSAAPEMSR